MLEPIEKKSLSRVVYERLRDQIVHGRLGAGESLPAERRLSDMLQVNRASVREALKRLEQARLVQIRQGGATTVLDWLQSAGLDLLAQLLLDRAGRVDRVAIRSLLEMRMAIGPDMARRCAERRSDAALDALEAAMDRTASAAEQPDEAAFFDAHMDLWSAIADGSENVAYRLALNSLRSAWAAVAPALSVLLAEEWSDVGSYSLLVHAIAAGDAARAEALARDIVTDGCEAAMALLDDLPSDPTGRWADVESWSHP